MSESTVFEIAPTRSSFVTVVAWIFIVLAGFATLISIMQNVMISVFMPVEDMGRAMRAAEKHRSMPWFAKFVFSNFRLMFALFFVAAAGMLIAAIGLLRRKNWARILFIVIMVLAIVWNVAGLAFPFFMYGEFTGNLNGMPPEAGNHFRIMMIIMFVFSALIAVSMSVLFGWIIKRLLSAEIKREFV